MAIEVKRGDSFSLFCTRTDADGDAVNLTGVTVTSQMRYRSELIDLTPTIVSAAAGTFTLTADAAATESWAVVDYDCNVQFSSGGQVVSTATFQVRILEDVTVAA
jgi:hypothetical protein